MVESIIEYYYLLAMPVDDCPWAPMASYSVIVYDNVTIVLPEVILTELTIGSLLQYYFVPHCSAFRSRP